MFDHLDDPEPYRPTPGDRARAVARGRRLLRRRRLVRSGVGTVLAVVVATGAALAYVGHRLDDVDRVEVRDLAPERADRGDPYDVLVLGVDGPAAAGAPRDGFIGERADTIVVAHVDPARNTVTTLPLYRDLWGPLPDGRLGRLNQAYADGGASGVVASLKVRYGLEVDHVVVVDPAGADALVDEVGGLSFRFTRPVRDLTSGLSVDRAGCTELDGREVLALGRSRHYQALVDGVWHEDPQGDLSRVTRQAVVGQAAVDAMGRLGTGPLEVARLIDAMVDHVALDERMTIGDLLALARHLHGARVQTVRPEVRDAQHGGAAVLELTSDGDDAIGRFRALQQGASAPTSPAPSGADQTTGEPPTSAPSPTPPAAEGPYSITPC